MNFPLPSDKGKQILRILAHKKRLIPAHLRKVWVQGCRGIGKNLGFAAVKFGGPVALGFYCCSRLHLRAWPPAPK
jgi:hypothetical protein